MRTYKRKFHLGDVLSVTTGKLLSLEGMDGIYKILNFMTNDDLFTHQLPRAMDECRPYLIAEYPFLENITADEVTPENFHEWIKQKCDEYGEYLEISALPKHAHEFIDPISELVEKVHPDKIFIARRS